MYNEFSLSLDDIEIIRRNDLINLIYSRMNKENIDINKAGSFTKIKDFIIDELRFLRISLDD